MVEEKFFGGSRFPVPVEKSRVEHRGDGGKDSPVGKEFFPRGRGKGESDYRGLVPNLDIINGGWAW